MWNVECTKGSAASQVFKDVTFYFFFLARSVENAFITCRFKRHIKKAIAFFVGRNISIPLVPGLLEDGGPALMLWGDEGDGRGCGFQVKRQQCLRVIEED